MGKVTKKFIVIMMLVSLVFCNNSTVVLATEISDFIEENTIAEETETIDSVDEAITAPEEASDNDEVVTEENNDAATAEEVIEDSENISETEKVDEKDEKSEVVDETATEAVEDDEKSEELAEDVEPDEKAEDEPEEKVNMPEANFKDTAGDIEVTVHADEDIFPEGTTMKLRLINQSEIYDVVNKAVEGNVAEIQAVDITFMHEGKEIEPAGPVSVNLKTTKTETSNNQVVHIDDNKKVDVIDDAQINEEAAKVTAAFDAEKFSVYAIISIDDDGNETTEVFFRTYNFKDIDSTGTYVDYEFQTVSGNTLTSQKVKNGDKLESVGTPYHPNHTFIGWFLDDGTGKPGNTPVVFDTALDLSSLTADESVNVYAKYSDVYYVSFYEYDKTTPDADNSVLTTRITDSNGVVKIGDVSSATTGENLIFYGWINGETEYDLYDENNNLDKNKTITVSENTKLYPKFVEAYWLRFISAEVGMGASYIPSRFVLAGHPVTKVSVPTMEGYSFVGWFDGEEQITDGEGNVIVSGGLLLTADKTLEGEWEPNSNSPYKVIFWLQKVTDDKDAADNAKTYDYWDMDASRTGVTGSVVTSTSEDQSRTVPTNVSSAKFHYARTEVTNNGVLNANGSTVVNVYYDRDLVKINFYYRNNHQPDGATTAYNYTATTGNNGTQYGVLTDGSYVELTRKSSTTTRVYYTYDPGWFQDDVEYTGTFYTRRGNGWNARYTATQYNGNNLPPAGDNTTYYTSDHDELTRHEDNVTTYSYTYTVDGVEHEYTGTRYTRSSNSTYPYMVTWTGLSGQSFSMYDYTYPVTYKWNEASNGGGTTQTFLTAFTQNNESYNLYDQNEQGQSKIYHYKQALDGKYYETEGTYRYTVNGNGGSFHFQDKFEGFKVNSYSTGNNGFNTNGGSNTNLSNTPSSYPLHVYHLRNKHNLIYKNGNAEVATEQNIYYEASLSGYNKTAEQVGLTVQDHYKFDGWYADAGLTKPFDFNSTMPDANVVVYAKVSKVDYKITIDPAGGVITPEIGATYFWEYYQEKVERYNGVSREYIEDPNGTYKYVYYDGAEYQNWNDPPAGTPRTATYVEAEAGYTGTKYRKINPTVDPTYSLVGWYEVDSNGNVSSTPYDFNNEIDRNITLRAVWRLSGSYAVMYHGIAEVEKKDHTTVEVTGILKEDNPTDTFSDGAEIVAMSAPTVDPHFVFEGWEIVAGSETDSEVLDDNGGDYYQPGELIKLKVAQWANNKIIHIRAHYKAAEESEDVVSETFIIYNANGGTVEGITESDNTEVTSTTVKISKLNINDSMRTYGEDNFKREGYILDGWNTVKAQADAGVVEFKVNHLVGIDNLVPKENTVYAVWVEEDHLIYDKNAADATGTMEDSINATGRKVTVKSNEFSRPGYTFAGWNTASNGSGTAYGEGGEYTLTAAEDRLYAQWTPRTDTKYKVEHYLEDLNADTFTLKDTENLTGTTDATATATPKTYEGFTLDESVEGTKKSGIITADGELVLKLYYTRNVHKVTYEYEGTVPNGASALPAEASYKYGASVTVADDATAPGYTFSGWDKQDFTMPNNDVVIKGSFTAKTDTPYKVEHYLEDLNADTFTLKDTENLTGTTDTEVSASPKTYEGFTFDSSVEGTKVSGTITGDGKLVLKLYYTRNSYKVTYEYEGTVPTGASELPAEATYEYGAQVTVADDATAPGYTFSGWDKQDFTMPAEDVVIKGSFTANENTAYKVEHYLEDLNADTFTLKDTENLTGTTDTEVSASPKTYEGFTFDSSVEGTKVSGTITGDGKLVLKLYYTRNSYKVTYEYEGTVPTGASELPAEATYEYGAQVTVADDATAPGYTFSGWDKQDFTMPANDVVIKGSFTANEDTAYKVEHYLEDLNADTFTLKDTENLSGTTDTEVSASPKTYEGFTFDSSVEGTKVSGTITGDGKLVLKLYYTRNSYKVTYEYEGTVPTGASELPAEATYEYGAQVTVADDATAPGYTFSGWDKQDFTMPAEDVVIKGSFTANTDTGYTVEYYLQNVDNDEFTLNADATDNLTGTTGETVDATIKTFEGFTFDRSNNNNVLSGTIAGNGSLVLKVYYTRNTYKVTYKYVGTVPTGASTLPTEDTYKYGENVAIADPATAPGYTFSGWSRTEGFTMPAEDVEITGSFTANGDTAYKVEHYLEDLNADTFTLKDTENLSGETDSLAIANPKTYEGFTFDNTVSGTKESGIITGDGNLVLKLYYTRNSYKVTYEYEGTVPTGASALPAEASYEYGASVTVAENATAPGYTFSGWDKQDFTMPAEDVVIKGSFTANEDTAYKVEHYLEDLNADTFTLKDTENLTGTTDTTVSASPKTYEGFTFDSSVEGTKQTGVITGDGKLVLKLYYTRNSYKVTYEYEGTVPTGASELPAEASYEYGASVTVAENATAPGYTFSGWDKQDFTMPAEDVVIKGSFTANEDTAYKVEHYLEDLNADTFTLKDTENLTGTTDTTVSASPKTYEGFTFDSSVEGTKVSGTITGDGKLVLKLYYTRNSYKVTYEYEGTVPTGASELPAEASYEYGASVTVADDATAPGYTFSGWDKQDFTMPAEDVVIKGSFTANEDTAYKVEHYLEDLNAETFTLKDTENLTGTTDTTVSASPKTYEGFTFDSSVEGTKQTGVITGDGKLVLKLYYTRNSYKVTYEYEGTVPTGASELPAEATYEYGAQVTVADDATAPGYTFSGWDKDDFEMPAEDVVIKGSFTANEDTAYKVEHYLEDLNADTFTLKDTENLTGTTDTEVSASPKTYEGFTFDSSVEGTKQTGVITGDGKLVLKLYYTRNSYKVTYEYEGKVPTGASELPAEATYEYGASVTVAEDATAPGYDFSGWDRDDFEMPAEDVVIKGSFEARTDTAYKVEHYLEDLNADTFTLKETENLTGETDTMATANPKTYEGFTFDVTVEGTKQTGTITGDGKLVLKLYYTRNSYTVSYTYANEPAGASALPAETTYEYGAQVTVADDATAPGYDFDGWDRDDFTMPAEDVVITGSFTARTDTSFIVEHYVQDLDAVKVLLDGVQGIAEPTAGFTLRETENLTGETDTMATATPKEFEGFTFDATVEGTIQSGIIAGDGSLILRLYYTRNIYTVTYAYDNDPVPNGASELPAPARYAYEQDVTVAEDATAPGYTFSGWDRDDFKMPAEDVEIVGTFEPNEDTAYTVEYYLQNLNDDNYTLTETDSLTGTTDTEAQAEIKTFDGFTFEEDNENNVLSGIIAGDGSLVLKVYYTRNTDTKYKVEHYVQDVDAAGNPIDSFTLKETENLTGTTGEPVSGKAKSYEGYMFDSTIKGTVLTGIIAGDGSLVLKLYYTKVPVQKEVIVVNNNTTTETIVYYSPKTGDNITTYFGTMVLSVIGMIIASSKIKKRKANKK